jgi:hypothetical protein
MGWTPSATSASRVDSTGLQTSSIRSPGVPLAFVTTTFGPRYRCTRAMGSRRETLSIFGEALLGEANAFHSVLPSAHGATDSANSLALQVGGGIDVGLSRHFAFRALQAGVLKHFWHALAKLGRALREDQTALKQEGTQLVDHGRSSCDHLSCPCKACSLQQTLHPPLPPLSANVRIAPFPRKIGP